MDLALLIVTAVASLAAVASAIVAIVEARRAKQSKADAAEARDAAQVAQRETVELSRVATAAFIRQAAAQERANEIREEDRRPKSWTGPRHVSGARYSVANTSERVIFVDHFEVDPDEAGNLVNFDLPSKTIPFGGSFDYILANRMGLRARVISVFWRFDDEPDGELNEFRISL